MPRKPAQRRDFMLRAALLQELSPEACRWDFQEKDAADLLEGMEADHLVRRLTGGVTYRFPTYLRDFLLAELGVAPADTDAPRPVEASPAPNLVESIADLSDEEVERQLAARAKRKQ